MFRRRRTFHGPNFSPTTAFASVALALGTCVSLPAHEEWNNLHIVYSAQPAYVYPFDGRTPKIAVALLNHHETVSPAVRFALSVNGETQSLGGFATFPDGAAITVAPDDYMLASVSTGSIFEGRVAPPPGLGETKEFTFDFSFRLVDPATAILDPEEDQPEVSTLTTKVRFTNLGDNPVLTGPLVISGSVRFTTTAGSPAPANARVEVATPYSNWFPLALLPAPVSAGSDPNFTFSQALPARPDWHFRFSADGYETRVVELGPVNGPFPSLNLTLAPAAALDLDYRRLTAIQTSTGFWRGAVSETEDTFVTFPGQEIWPSTATTAEARALRSAARLAKYKFDGTKLWEHAPGWETWAGDMTPDGRFVAYALNPTVTPFYTPAENKLVLLDGATGTVLWTKSAAPADSAVGRKLDSLELALSPDARWIAVGTVGSGQVSLVDRVTGSFVWTVPGAGALPGSWGQIRKLRFSPDGQFLYCGSGDSQLRKLRVSDGAVQWRVFAGGWPRNSGLDLTPDGSWLVAGTHSLDLTAVRTGDGQLQWQKETQFPDAVAGPHAATAGGQIYRLLDGSIAGMTKASALARFTPDGRHLLQIERDLRLYDLGGKLLKTFEASGLGTAEQSQWAHLTRDGRYAVILARDLSAPAQTGIVIYERRAPSSTATAPVITAPPLPQTAAIGGSAILRVDVTGTAPVGFQWRKNGADLPGQNAAALTLAALSTADAATYTCVVTNAVGSITTAPAALALVAPDAANPSRLANLSVRTRVGPTPLIVGFVVGGAGTVGQKNLLIRGAGPSLANLGVTGALADPRLVLFSGGSPILANDNWAGDATVTLLGAQTGAFPLASATSRDAALAATAVGGAYSVQIVSADASAGIALAEIYDGTSAFAAVTPRLVNLSARTDAGGANPLIAGFVVAGPAAKTVLVRGVGPALAAFGVRDALADPQLTLFRDTAVIATNDNWYESPNPTALATDAQRVGAFALAPTARDAALLLSLPPGNYTAQLTAATAGSALIEIYEVP